jgi:hypothetical protein
MDFGDLRNYRSAMRHSPVNWPNDIGFRVVLAPVQP